MHSRIDQRLRRLESLDLRTDGTSDWVEMRPNGDVLEFVYRGSVAYVMPLGDALDIDWGMVSSIPSDTLQAIVDGCKAVGDARD